MWNIILWFVIGGGVGWLARRYVRLGSPGLVPDIVSGAAGALIANVALSQLISGYFSFTVINGPALIVAVVAAAALVIIVRATRGLVRAA
ncbi:MAG TPA: hypothetical protein VF812_07220 [Ktedonobacterales bacterium]